jgi:hypothetical protein
MHTKFWLESLKIDHSKKPRHRWEDNIKMDLKEQGGCGLDSYDSGERPGSFSLSNGQGKRSWLT